MARSRAGWVPIDWPYTTISDRRALRCFSSQRREASASVRREAIEGDPPDCPKAWYSTASTLQLTLPASCQRNDMSSPTSAALPWRKRMCGRPLPEESRGRSSNANTGAPSGVDRTCATLTCCAFERTGCGVELESMRPLPSRSRLYEGCGGWRATLSATRAAEQPLTDQMQHTHAVTPHPGHILPATLAGGGDRTPCPLGRLYSSSPIPLMGGSLLRKMCVLPHGCVAISWRCRALVSSCSLRQLQVCRGPRWHTWEDCVALML